MIRRRRELPNMWLYEVKTNVDEANIPKTFYLMSEGHDDARVTAGKLVGVENILQINEIGHALSDYDDEANEELEKWKPKPLQDLVVQIPRASKLRGKPFNGIVGQNPLSVSFSEVLKSRGIIDQENQLYECEVFASLANGASGGSSKVVMFFVVANDLTEARELCEHSVYIGPDCGRAWQLQRIKTLGFSYLKKAVLALAW